MQTDSFTSDDPAHQYAHALLNSPAGALEDNIRQNIVRLLNAMQVDSFLSYRITPLPNILWDNGPIGYQQETP